ncbi:glycosyltransferase [Roseovarius sp.]|uniref:glycosyltransferase n=1 Tax=Roseovarius sp. TaxID=1486281 RepID=UPI003A9773F5
MNTPDTLKKDAENIRKSGDFDADWYLKTYPDVAALGMDPAEHYLQYGRMLGRPPRPESAALPVQEPSSTTLPPLAEAYSSQSLQAYLGPSELPVNKRAADLPRVSVVMTSHNAEDTIENAVTSLINQSWPNIEIIVCDDRSTDSTWSILLELRRRSPKTLKIIRLECNSGTYIAKNIAIESASGEFILFQDSDDYSHPDRVMVQVLPLLEDRNLLATRTKYCRFDPETGRIIPVAGLLSKYGLITLAVRRKVFAEIGYFDAVRRAGDDEWYQRLLHLYGKSVVKGLDVTLYLAELRQNSLIADMLTFNVDGSVEQNSSRARRTYVDQFQSRFADKSKNALWYRTAFSAVPSIPVEEYPDTIAALRPNACPVFASVCSIPRRKDQLAHVVRRILPQVDHLYVYLDKYDDTPDFLKNNPAITVWHARDFDRDFRDNGKFLAYDELKKRHKPFYYVTCDDDLVYPHDYVRTLIDRIETYERKVIAGVHGVVCEEHPKAYFQHRFLYHFIWDSPSKPRLVNNLGTGTTAFHSDLFESLDPRAWSVGGMVDIFFAKEARRANVPMLSIDRKAFWLREAEMPQDNPTLFNEFNEKEKIILQHLNECAPLGYKGILSVLEHQPEPLRTSLHRLLPTVANSVSVEQTLHRLRGR